jgi:hypothetical protein
MAYMNQEKKAKIAAALKQVMPKDWKYSLRVMHHSTIIMTIQSAPVDLYTLCTYESKSSSYIQLNEYYLENAYKDEKILAVLLAAKSALNIDNWDKSDIQTDYFNVGHYAHIHIGGFGKPFAVRDSEKPTAAPQEAPAPVAEAVVVPQVVETIPQVEAGEPTLTADELLTAARSIWMDACAYDSIDPDSKFVVFSMKNPFVQFHNTAMSRYFAASAR